MRSIVFSIITILGVSSMLQAEDMTPEEAQERARIVTMGGD